MSSAMHPSASRATLHQHRERAVLDDAPAFLAAGIVAHVGIADDQGPVVIPMTYQYDAAEPETLYLHGAHNSRLMLAVASGAPVCVTVTLVDGLVYSKTALNHSVNYRSVVAFCRAAAEQPDADRKRAILDAARPPSRYRFAMSRTACGVRPTARPAADAPPPRWRCRSAKARSTTRTCCTPLDSISSSCARSRARNGHCNGAGIPPDAPGPIRVTSSYKPSPGRSPSRGASPHWRRRGRAAQQRRRG